MLSGASAHTTGAPGLVASIGSTTDGSTSYSIAIASSAVGAATRDVATTAATGSRAKRTISWASSRRGGAVIDEPSGRLKTSSVGSVPVASATRSAPGETGWTPGS